jgi:RHS repeat-associated protein
MIKNNILMKVIPEKTLCRIFTCILISLHTTNSYAQSGGVIILNQPTPATAVRVTATEQIVLKPGFQASASRGSFSAKISSSNSIVPLIDIAQESPFQIPVASNDQNYIKTSTPLLADINSPVMTTIQYFDGLGRPSQTVQMGITPEGADLVLLTQYDDVGREWKNWLPTPIEGNFGQYVNESSFTSNASSKHNDNNPYAENRYESSPLNRVKEQFGAGANWHTNNKRVVTNYSTNDSNIVYFHINESENLARNGNYYPATLYKTTVSDEDGKPVSEYKDKLGRIVLKEGALNTRTYYVYNDLGQLSYVIPPIAADSLPNTTGPIYDNNGVLKRYAYLYKYDERGNQTYKRFPGCEPIRMVYDKANRLILSQDGNQKLKQQWLVNKYDVLGRLLYTGIIEDSTPHEDLIADLRDEIITELWNTDVDIDNTGYTCGTFTPERLLTVNYYDNYSFVSLTDNSLNYDAGKENQFGNKHPSAKGLLTGTRTYLLDGSNNYTATAQYYDYKGQVIQSRSSNHLGGHDYAYNQYNFTGNVTKTLKEHNIAGQSTVTELYDYTYDHALRLKTISYKLNNKPSVVLSSNTYDELGRLVEKKRHSNADTEEFEYNIRGWATKIKSGDFEQNLLYHTGLPQGATACYNGNIAYTTWKYNGLNKGYIFSYDNLNRLSSGVNTDSNHQYEGYSSEGFSYDKQGNISSLWRTGNGGDMDNLSFGYNGNQIQWIFDDAGSCNLYNLKEYTERNNSMDNPQTEFFYDSVGNMTADLDRDIVTIKYNLLNLPELIQFKNGCQIKHTYSAGGQKLSSRYIAVNAGVYQPLNQGDFINYLDVNENDNVTVDGMDYIGNIEYQIYRYFDWDVTFEPAELKYIYRIHNPEGFATNATTTNGPIYSYYRKDHLGNNREVWRASYTWGSTTHAAATVQKTQYYPSGLPWKSNSGDNPGSQPYKYGGKEFVEMHGYDVTDLGNRGVHHATNRFTTMDRFCEKFPWQSPYVHAGNNPVNYVDVNGDFPVFLIPLAKGAIGAVADAAAQVTVSMANGQSFGQAMSSIDYTSVGASFVTSAIAVPGMSAAAKVATVAVVATDAAIDINAKGEIQTIGGVIGENKSITSTAIDALSSVVPGKVVENVTSSFNKAVSSDLGSNAAATLTKETKSSLKQVQVTVNSTAVQTGANAAADYVGKIVGGQANKVTAISSAINVSVPSKAPLVQPNDATRVQQPIYPIYTR